MDEVKALGPNPEPNVYASRDRSPSLGINYYRLKQLDLNGQFSYSEVLEVDFQPASSLTVFPNPVLKGSELLAEVSLVDDSPFRIDIHSLDGRLIRTYAHEGIRTRTRVSMDVADLAEGMYVISIRSRGKLLSAERVLIQAH